MTSLAFAYTGPHSWPVRTAMERRPYRSWSTRRDVPCMVGSAFHRRPPQVRMWWVRTAMERRPYRAAVIGADGDGTPSLPVMVNATGHAPHGRVGVPSPTAAGVDVVGADGDGTPSLPGGRHGGRRWNAVPTGRPSLVRTAMERRPYRTLEVKHEERTLFDVLPVGGGCGRS